MLVARGFLSRVAGNNQFVLPFRESCAMLLLANSIKAGSLCPFLVHYREGAGHKRVDQSMSISGSPLFPGASCLGCAREKIQVPKELFFGCH